MGGGGEPVAIAQSLVERGAFADPFIATARTGPTAQLPPLYPLFMALILKLFGDGRLLVVFTILVHGLHASLLPSLSRLFFKSSAPGIFAGVLSTALPVFVVFPAWDAMYTATGLILFCLLTANLTMHAEHDIRSGVLAGIGGALLLLINPATLTVLLCWMVFLAITKLKETPRIVRTCTAFTVALVLGCTPWTIRNYERFHAFVFIRDNFGLALYKSNNDCAQSNLVGNNLSGCADLKSAFNPAETRLIVTLGEVEYNRYRMAAALDWIRTHPKRFAVLTLRRFVEFWYPPHASGIWIITSLSGLGLLLLLARKDPVGGFLVAVLATFPGIYYVIESNVRYRYPILWVSLLMAGYALAALGTSASRIPFVQQTICRARVKPAPLP